MQWRAFRNSSYQVATVFALIALFAMLFVWYWLTIAADDTLLRESEAALLAEQRFFASQSQMNTDAASTLVAERLRAPQTDWFYAVSDQSGSQVAGNLPAAQLTPEGQSASGARFYELAHAAVPERQGSRRLMSDHFDLLAREIPLSDGGVLIIARDVDDIEIAQWVANIFGWAMIALMGLILLLGYGVAYYVASRVERIADTTQRIIATGNLDERLSVDGEWDDLSKLATLLNDMLAEMATRIDAIKSVTDSIAHDLRTPLMRIRSTVDQQTDGEVRDTLLNELDRTLDLFRSLLRISAIEAGKQRLERQLTSINRIMADAVSLYELLAEDKSVTLRLLPSSDIEMTVDRDLLFQVIVNLIDNAVKFTPSGGAVMCSLSRGPAEVTLVIEDSGPGIDPEDRDRALERFSRLDQSRSQPGHGLGLPLAKAIVERHGGTLRLESAGPGLRVLVDLPLAESMGPH